MAMWPSVYTVSLRRKIMKEEKAKGCQLDTTVCKFHLRSVFP